MEDPTKSLSAAAAPWRPSRQVSREETGQASQSLSALLAPLSRQVSSQASTSRKIPQSYPRVPLPVSKPNRSAVSSWGKTADSPTDQVTSLAPLNHQAPTDRPPPASTSSDERLPKAALLSSSVTDVSPCTDSDIKAGTDKKNFDETWKGILRTDAAMISQWTTGTEDRLTLHKVACGTDKGTLTFIKCNGFCHVKFTWSDFVLRWIETGFPMEELRS